MDEWLLAIVVNLKYVDTRLEKIFIHVCIQSAESKSPLGDILTLPIYSSEAGDAFTRNEVGTSHLAALRWAKFFFSCSGNFQASGTLTRVNFLQNMDRWLQIWAQIVFSAHDSRKTHSERVLMEIFHSFTPVVNN